MAVEAGFPREIGRHYQTYLGYVKFRTVLQQRVNHTPRVGRSHPQRMRRGGIEDLYTAIDRSDHLLDDPVQVSSAVRSGSIVAVISMTITSLRHWIKKQVGATHHIHGRIPHSETHIATIEKLLHSIILEKIAVAVANNISQSLGVHRRNISQDTAGSR